MDQTSVQTPLSDATVLQRRHLTVFGVVQGVGFRPFIVTLARRLGLRGWVRNALTGVELEVQGTAHAIDAFACHIRENPPPLARVLELVVEPVPLRRDAEEAADLVILSSDLGGVDGHTDISPDAATCPECVQEILDPASRRHDYAFTNCTQCGPRFTIIRSLPYDRPRTSMNGFQMCADCRRDYEDPDDRRFHAQPIACPHCGPSVWFAGVEALSERGAGRVAGDPAGAFAVDTAAQTMADGGVVAIRGIGGFHLACRADNARALARLRTSKFRPSKPFAVMMASVEEAVRYCEVDEAEARLLQAPEAPIVLLTRRRDSNRCRLPVEVAPQNPSLGVMLPFTPLHHMLMQEAGVPLVMTSGNLAGEPLCVTNEEAIQKLSPFVDAFLLHDRPIERRCDDSVMMVVKAPGGPVTQPVRRSRGLVPLPVLLPQAVSLDEAVLATGGELKNTAALATGRSVFLTQHNGDMETLATREAHARGLADLEALFHIRPRALACDMHPAYASTRYARERARREGLPVIEVQHHHAHIAGCLAENNRTDRVIGLCFDGTGYGTDGRIWGGEVLVADLERFDRRYHLDYMPLPGGDAAIRHPWRTALAYLSRLTPEVDPEPWFEGIPDTERQLVKQMVASGVHVMPTSSMGRLFDAVSALLGVCREATHEGHAAIALEAFARECGEDPAPYPVRFGRDTIGVKEILRGVLADLRVDRKPSTIAMAFHRTVAAISAAAAERIREAEPALQTVALSGGVWQNRLVLEETVRRLEQKGFEMLLHHAVPPNDGGLAYGQAAVAAAILKADRV